MTAKLLPDADARDAVRNRLDVSMLVEAGAGSGKTTLITDRMLSLIRSGVPVEQIAAITFTRKAAAELNERFVAALERNAGESDAAARALAERDRMFVGTIHSFCARLLRDHAIEAGVSPGFVELEALKEAEFAKDFWRTYLLRAQYSKHPQYEALREAGINAANLFPYFRDVHANRNATLTTVEAPAPLPDAIIDKLKSLHIENLALSLLAPSATWGLLERLIHFNREYSANPEAWLSSSARVAQFLRTLSRNPDRPGFLPNKTLLGRTNDAKAPVNKLRDLYAEFVQNALPMWETKWAAHVYPRVVEFLQAASDAAVDERRRRALFTFDDLVLETARLLRERPALRQSVGRKWTRILIDEFQDTDPAQAEMAMWLAAPAAAGSDWTTVQPEAGRLFLVGDPKQSIYRFRRADIETYESVKRTIGENGQVVQLTSNFRSAQAIADVVNGHFSDAFGSSANNGVSSGISSAASNGVNSSGTNTPNSAPIQAPFAPMNPAGAVTTRTTGTVARYIVEPIPKETPKDIIKRDAQLLASWIYQRIVSGDRAPKDFLILTSQRSALRAYARALAEYSLPVSASGIQYETDALINELIVILRAIAEPANGVQVVAALEGIMCGATHEELLNHGGNWIITAPPHESSSNVGRALAQLHNWWQLSCRLTVTALIDRILDDLALLPLLASGELGDSRAGSLLGMLAALRQLQSDTSSIESVIDAIELMQQAEESPPSLLPDKSDAIRIMNLHRAKGLESKVVILAAPVPDKGRNKVPSLVVLRDANGTMQASLCVTEKDGLVAAPEGWDTIVAEDQRRQQAEIVRLLYVAATRAEEELVVSQHIDAAGTTGDLSMLSPWAPLAHMLTDTPAMEMVAADAPPRGASKDTDGFRTRFTSLQERHIKALQPRYRLTSVTEVAQSARAGSTPIDESYTAAAHAPTDTAATDRESVIRATPPERPHAPRFDDPDIVQDDSISAESSSVYGLNMGNAVHAVLDELLRGRPVGEMPGLIDAIAWEVWGREGTSDEHKPRLAGLVAEAMSSPVWQQLEAHRASGTIASELRVAALSTEPTLILDGVIDVLSIDNNQARVIDWKTSGGERKLHEHLPAYEIQRQLYAEIMRRRSGLDASSELVILRHD